MTFNTNLSVKSAANIIGVSLLLMPIMAACSDPNVKEASLNTVDAANAAAAKSTIEIGVLITDNPQATRERYLPALSELEKSLGKPVTVVPVPQESQLAIVEKGDVDFIISNPIASEKMQRLYGTEILATIAWPEIGSQYAGSIIIKPDSPITTVSDLKDKKGVCVSMQTSAAGCLFQMYHLQQNGLNPYQDVVLAVNPSQDKIVQSVLDGEQDFGFIRMDHLQRMVDRGLLSSVDELRVLEPIQGSTSPMAHTTQLYPGWAIAATADVPDALATQLQEALLNLPTDSGGLASADIEQFVPAADYSELDPIIDEMRLLQPERSHS